jgi:hypothetical protein
MTVDNQRQNSGGTAREIVCFLVRLRRKHSGPRSSAASWERVRRSMDDVTVAMLCSRFGPPKISAMPA